MLSGAIMKAKYKNKMNRLKTSNIHPQESGKTFPSSNCTNQREGMQVLNMSNGWTNKGEMLMLEAANLKSKANINFSKDPVGYRFFTSENVEYDASSNSHSATIKVTLSQRQLRWIRMNYLFVKCNSTR